MSTLLSIDLGLRCGFATYSSTGQLLRYRSTNFGSVSRLRSAAWNIVKDNGPPEVMVLEGDRKLASIWSRVAKRMDCQVITVAPETWRAQLLVARQRRSGQDAKDSADHLARAIIDWSDAPGPTSLRHDAAEAILIGLWGVMHVGWLDELPPSINSALSGS